MPPRGSYGKRTITFSKEEATRLYTIIDGLTLKRVGNRDDYEWLSSVSETIEAHFGTDAILGRDE